VLEIQIENNTRRRTQQEGIYTCALEEPYINRKASTLKDGSFFSHKFEHLIMTRLVETCCEKIVK
jgi:hypothetical protein